MASTTTRMQDFGAWLLVASSAVCLVLSAFNYFSTDNGIHGTPGALVVIVSSALIFAASLVVALDRAMRLALRILLLVAILLGIVGTGFAAWLLEADILLAAMVVALAGWCVNVIAGSAQTHELKGAPRLNPEARQ